MCQALGIEQRPKQKTLSELTCEFKHFWHVTHPQKLRRIGRKSSSSIPLLEMELLCLKNMFGSTWEYMTLFTPWMPSMKATFAVSSLMTPKNSLSIWYFCYAPTMGFFLNMAVFVSKERLTFLFLIPFPPILLEYLLIYTKHRPQRLLAGVRGRGQMIDFFLVS